MRAPIDVHPTSGTLKAVLLLLVLRLLHRHRRHSHSLGLQSCFNKLNSVLHCCSVVGRVRPALEAFGFRPTGRLESGRGLNRQSCCGGGDHQAWLPVAWDRARRLVDQIGAPSRRSLMQTSTLPETCVLWPITYAGPRRSPNCVPSAGAVRRCRWDPNAFADLRVEQDSTSPANSWESEWGRTCTVFARKRTTSDANRNSAKPMCIFGSKTFWACAWVGQCVCVCVSEESAMGRAWPVSMVHRTYEKIGCL